MKKVCVLLFVLISTMNYAQDFDKYMIHRKIDCEDVAYNCGLLYEQFLSENKVDSAESVIQYWQNNCGLQEPVLRAKILLALKMGTYSDTLLADNILNYILNYQDRREFIKMGQENLYDSYKSYFGNTPINQSFDKFTEKYALILKSNYGAGTIENLLCEFYSSNCDTIFTKIQNDPLSASKIGIEYNKEVDKYLRLPETHFALSGGTWIPTGRAKQWGVHSCFGMKLGWKKRKMSYDISVNSAGGKSKNEYYARKDQVPDSLMLTNDFTVSNLSIDFGRDIYSKNGVDLKVTLGVGMDMLYAFPEEKEKNIKATVSNSYNFNLGLESRYFFTNVIYVGLIAKYNFVDYTMGNVVDFTGNPIVTQICTGVLLNGFKNQKLSMYKKRWRK